MAWLTDLIEADAARSYARMTAAPVLIALCLSMVDMDVYPDEKRNRNEYLMAVQSTAMAGQNLLLAAHEAGLGRVLDVRAAVLPGCGAAMRWNCRMTGSRRRC